MESNSIALPSGRVIPQTIKPVFPLKLSCSHTVMTIRDIADNPPATFWCRECTARVKTRG